MKREEIPRPPLVRATLDKETRELLHRMFSCYPSGKVILNVNDGGVLHADLDEAKRPRADKQ